MPWISIPHTAELKCILLFWFHTVKYTHPLLIGSFEVFLWKRSTGGEGTECAPEWRGRRETRKEVYVLAEGSFYVTLSGSLRQEDTHDYEYTHTHEEAEASPDPTHINTNTILIRNQSERTGALPVPGWEPCPPRLSSQVLHRPGGPDALGWGLYPDQRVFLDGEPHRRRAADPCGWPEERQAVREGAGGEGTRMRAAAWCWF